LIKKRRNWYATSLRQEGQGRNANRERRRTAFGKKLHGRNYKMKPTEGVFEDTPGNKNCYDGGEAANSQL